MLEIGFSKKFSHNDDYWLNITAAKLVEELESIARDEVIGAFEYLDVWHAPAGENLHLLNAWYEGQRNFYLTKPKKIEDFANLLSLTPGFPYRQVIKKAKILAADTRKAKQIQDIYSVLLKQAKKEYEKLSSKAG
ncbi:hypothetical protein D6827_01415 [Candidatus Parcubacteria bacterium]|nr:MAG: hypothetical protein D6827_01415 [Candidatus Parcubacteria bacterium]